MTALSLSWQLSYSNTYLLPVNFTNMPPPPQTINKKPTKTPTENKKPQTSEHEEVWKQEWEKLLGEETAANDEELKIFQI